MTSSLIYVPPVQGQRKPNEDKHDAATTPLTGPANFPHHLAPILILLPLLFCPLMFIQVLIIILFFLPPRRCWHSWLFLPSLLSSPAISLSSSFLQLYIPHLYHLIHPPLAPSLFIPSLFAMRWQGPDCHSQWDGSEQKSKAKGQLIPVVTQRSPPCLLPSARIRRHPSILTSSTAHYSPLSPNAECPP